MEKIYVRDKRSPSPKHEGVSRVMSANKAKNTKPEITLRKELWRNGVKGYRLNWKKVPGRPDITFPGRKIAIFVNGCFWHRCPNCNYTLPKHNTNFWENKFSKNTVRDKIKQQNLEEMGWKVFVIWECEIKNNLKGIVENLTKKISSNT